MTLMFVSAECYVGIFTMVVHEPAGINTNGLIVFRIVWGWFGSTYARCSHCFPTPARIKAYFAGTWLGLGHNPIGAFSVFALLAVLLTQALTGLFSNDIAFNGPLFDLVSKDFSDSMTGFHDQ